ncbi:flavin mononucleotide-binding protein [Pelobium manganitolerans]|uniref:Flavin mononucleotide-binding protein n=1 Tax=Pelobium manganitolerans TaxID=1842495 RepID=A0A419S4B8_9SPHI|nr:pyridoxamine 5'-phosphate oxidase family protein [Pelobium manganitolerans]RKD14514.1 flavin mononucleotide-binding protein [Pelobium manganitolerans]
METLQARECIALLNENYIGHLAFIADEKPYTVPITYYFDQKDSIIAYAGEGFKIEAMRKNSRVALQVEQIEDVKNWRSVMVQGHFKEAFGSEAKFLLQEFANGVKNVISQHHHQHVRFISDFTSDVYTRGTTSVYRIKIKEMFGKKMVQVG